jgi:hypothetical protein
MQLALPELQAVAAGDASADALHLHHSLQHYANSNLLMPVLCRIVAVPAASAECGAGHCCWAAAGP